MLLAAFLKLVSFLVFIAFLIVLQFLLGNPLDIMEIAVSISYIIVFYTLAFLIIYLAIFFLPGIFAGFWVYNELDRTAFALIASLGHSQNR